MKSELRFFNHFTKIEGGCWLWCGGKHRLGYGLFKFNGKTRTTHRISWELHRGPIPSGLCVLHKCDVPACVNPEHLFLGTVDDNNKDKSTKGRCATNIHTYGELHWGARLTTKEVQEIRQLYSSGGITQKSLGIRFGVGQAAIWQIVNRKRWKHI